MKNYSRQPWPAAAGRGLTPAAAACGRHRKPPPAASAAAPAAAAAAATGASIAAAAAPAPGPQQGDTAWMMVSTLPRILTTPALFYGGLVAAEHAVGADAGDGDLAIVVLWFIWRGYSLAFTRGQFRSSAGSTGCSWRLGHRCTFANA